MIFKVNVYGPQNVARLNCNGNKTEKHPIWSVVKQLIVIADRTG